VMHHQMNGCGTYNLTVTQIVPFDLRTPSPLLQRGG